MIFPNRLAGRGPGPASHSLMHHPPSSNDSATWPARPAEGSRQPRRGGPRGGEGGAVCGRRARPSAARGQQVRSRRAGLGWPVRRRRGLGPRRASRVQGWRGRGQCTAGEGGDDGGDQGASRSFGQGFLGSWTRIFNSLHMRFYHRPL